MDINKWLRLLLLHILETLLFLHIATGHGRLWEPPSRPTMWRLGYKTPPDYNDNQLFCGGVGVQYSKKVNGRCGVCGDPWFGPRVHEAGGKYANGIITRKYQTGQEIDIKIQLTANHKGYFEFRLCAKDDINEKATWDCLNKHLLEIVTTGSTKYHVESPTQMKFVMKVRLPKGVKCKACFLQWKYNAGNSWGYRPDGTGCVGCGNQEQFYGCADVSVGYDELLTGVPRGKVSGTFESSGQGSGDGWDLDKDKSSGKSIFNTSTKVFFISIPCLLFSKLFLVL